MAEKRRSELAEYIIENQEKFYRLAFSYAKNKEAALDIVQNAIVKALELGTAAGSATAFVSWLASRGEIVEKLEKPASEYGL